MDRRSRLLDDLTAERFGPVHTPPATKATARAGALLARLDRASEIVERRRVLVQSLEDVALVVVDGEVA